MTNSQLTDLRTLILSEVRDFFAVVGSPGEPETPEEMQRELSMRLGRILNNHIVNYPRCEVLVEILRECRKARDEAQAGLQERRKAAMDSEPVAWTDEEELRDANESGSGYLFGIERDANKFADPRRQIMLYRHAQQAPVVPEEMPCGGAADDYHDGYQDGWNACRAAMLQAEPVCTCPSGDGSLRWPCPVHPGNSPVIPDGWKLVPVEPNGDMLAAAQDAYGETEGDIASTLRAAIAAAPQEAKTERKK
ncbi:hypothetical protein RFG81_003583 [Klebsiella aerogenes]|nr:hypothetical protein [Klebsiella aerogenes]